MTPIEYLKLQAKNLHKDFKTQTSSFDAKSHRNVYAYDPKYFKIDLLVEDFSINEEKFSLMNAQHIIAKLCGLQKWTDFSNASPAKIELSTLLYTNMDKLEVRDWDQYVLDIETSNNIKLDDEFKLQIFKEEFLEWQQDVYYDDYRLSKDEETEIEWEPTNTASGMPAEVISSLPLSKKDREEFIKVANQSFEHVFENIEPLNPELTRSLWNAEEYIDQVIKIDMLPIDRDYAMSLIEAFLIHHVIGLATEADQKDR